MSDVEADSTSGCDNAVDRPACGLGGTFDDGGGR